MGRTIHRALRAALAAGVAAALLAGCGSASHPAHGIALERCVVGGVQARCGILRVPENPGDPRGSKIPLSVAVVPARDPRPRRDPLLYFAGWGSAAIEDDLATAVPMLGQVGQSRDIVFVDQRGTGGSNRLTCPSTPGAERERPTDAAVTQLVRSCAARLGPNLRYYTSAVAADDADRVRRALGYREVNLYGISYGGTMAQVYLLRHGAHVRSVVLDGASLLDAHIFAQGGRNAQRALELLFARCRADLTCHATFPDPGADLERIQARLRRGPMTLPAGHGELTTERFADALDGLLAYTPTKAVVPRFLHLVASGRLAEASALIPDASAQAEQLPYQLLIQCSEPWASRPPAEVARADAGSFIAPLQARAATLVRAGCRGLPRGVAPRDLGRRVRSRVPVLLLTGAEDPADPPRNVAHARRELPNSRTVIFPGAGHGQLRLPCAQTILATFVARGSASGLDTRCARTAALPVFVTRR